MNDVTTDLFSNPLIEILPPERDEKPSGPGMTCLCCRRSRSRSAMDEDGCGICDECLLP